VLKVFVLISFTIVTKFVVPWQRSHLKPGERRHPLVGLPLSDEDAVVDAGREVVRLSADERAHRQDQLQPVIPGNESGYSKTSYNRYKDFYEVGHIFL